MNLSSLPLIWENYAKSSKCSFLYMMVYPIWKTTCLSIECFTSSFPAQNRTRQLRAWWWLVLGQSRNRLSLPRPEVVFPCRKVACKGQRWREVIHWTFPLRNGDGRIRKMWDIFLFFAPNIAIRFYSLFSRLYFSLLFCTFHLLHFLLNVIIFLF